MRASQHEEGHGEPSRASLIAQTARCVLIFILIALLIALLLALLLALLITPLFNLNAISALNVSRRAIPSRRRSRIASSVTSSGRVTEASARIAPC